MNSVELTGRLATAPELNSSNSGKFWGRFTLAVDRGTKDDSGNRQTDFIRCVVFGKTAEMLARFSNKGKLIGVTGSIQTGSYTNKEGQKVYTTDVMVRNIDILEWPSKDEKAQKEGFEVDSEPVPEGFAAVDEDIPF